MTRTKIKTLFALLTTVILMGSCAKVEKKQAMYSGEDLSKNATIIRDKESKVAQLKVDLTGDWTLYAGKTVDSINLDKPILTGKEGGVYSLDVPADERYYFMIETPTGTALMAERHLPMAGGFNFRDLGGFKTKDGRYTQWGKIFRSDDLNHLTDADLNYLSSIPLTTIVDFRSQKEVEAAPDKNPSSLKQNVHLAVEPGNLADIEQIARLSESEMEQFMVDLNEMLVTKPEVIEEYKQFFSLLQADNDIPLMFHCSAGKDRTGMGAALILSALGVDEATIMSDYLSSNEYLGDKYASLKAEHPNFVPLFEVRSKYLQAGLDKAKQEYGSIDNYLVDILKVDTAKMRQKYLY